MCNISVSYLEIFVSSPLDMTLYFEAVLKFANESDRLEPKFIPESMEGLLINLWGS